MNPNPNPNYIQSRNNRKVATMRAMKLLKEKAEEISQVCGAEVAVVSFPEDDVAPLFQGHPSLRAVLERFNGNDLGQDINSLTDALAGIDITELSAPELRGLRSRLQQFLEELGEHPA